MHEMTDAQKMDFARKFVVDCVLGGFTVEQKAADLVEVWKKDIANARLDLVEALKNVDRKFNEM